MEKRLTIKDAIEMSINKIDANLTINEFRSKLLELHPELANYSAYNHLSKYYAELNGYVFSKKQPNLYKVSTTLMPEIDKKDDLIITSVTTENINHAALKTYKTGTGIDLLFSNREGVMGGTQYEVSAPAGTGKTTLLAQIAKDLEANNPGYKALFISGEMDRSDWEIEVDENPSLSDLKTVFLLDYDDEVYDIRKIIIKALKEANFVIVDSSSAIVDMLMEQGHKRSEVERWLRKNIIQISKEQSSTIMVIKHVNKDGETAGSTKDKHMFTGKMVLEMTKSGQRRVYFEKNRRGGKYQKRVMYFTKDETGRLVFNRTLFDNETYTMTMVSNNNQEIDNDFKTILESRFKKLDTNEAELELEPSNEDVMF